MGNCARCESIFVIRVAKCSKCGVEFELCRNCIETWKNYDCPNCGTSLPNWKIT